jgi:catechol 2,3-dioxygenase-like lactoylglutathione lyase family enzyme
MDATTDEGRIEFGRIAATIPVTDMTRALDFYTRVMGMTKTFENGNPVGFAILKRDKGELFLSLDRHHKATTTGVCHLLISDARAFHDHCVKAGVRIIKGLRDQPYGLRDFIIADPDGNRIDIGQPISNPPKEPLSPE